MNLIILQSDTSAICIAFETNDNTASSWSDNSPWLCPEIFYLSFLYRKALITSLPITDNLSEKNSRSIVLSVLFTTPKFPNIVLKMLPLPFTFHYFSVHCLNRLCSACIAVE